MDISSRASSRRTGCPAETGDADSAGWFFQLGFTFVAAGSDTGTLARGTATLAAQCREKLP